jgi:parvulin-like peptidyl-prolyl isomerase
VSPKQGRRRTAGKGKDGSAKGPSREAVRRFGLAVFGTAFVVLFAIIAIAEGLGDPSVPSDAVAVIEDAPGDTGEVTQAEFDHALEQAAAQAQMKKTPKPGDPQYEEMKEAALSAIFESIWLQGLAEEMGITVSQKELDAELKKLKDESFQSEAEFQKFLKEAKYTQEDVDERVKLQKLSGDIQAQLTREAPKPTSSEIVDYYEAAKATQFTQQATRDVRLIVNKDRAKAEAARSALDGDNTAKNWAKVAKEFSEDPVTKESGGLQKGIVEGTLEEPLDKAVFGAQEGVLEGPIDAQRGFTVFEVSSSDPEAVQELKAVEGQIQSSLAQRTEQEFFNAFVATFTVEWTERTFCAEGYEIERCANFKGDGHPATAPPACYEADPDGGRPGACPAPVFQLVPAQPGSITPLEPQGRPLAQRPYPVGGAEEGATGTTGLPEGATPPPTGVPPAE